jgi:hypothetical protein
MQPRGATPELRRFDGRWGLIAVAHGDSTIWDLGRNSSFPPLSPEGALATDVTGWEKGRYFVRAGTLKTDTDEAGSLEFAP